MAAALPFIEGASALFGLYNGIKKATAPTPEAPPVLNMQQATEQAKKALNPIYDNQIADSMHKLDNNLINRGFFGQLPGAALEHTNQGQLENQRASAIANLAAQMQGQSFNQAATASQLAQQQARTALGVPEAIGRANESFRGAFPDLWASAFGTPPSDKAKAASEVLSGGFGGPSIQGSASNYLGGAGSLSMQPMAHPSAPTFQLNGAVSNPYSSGSLY